jgi:hypothetical protein
MSSSWRSPFVGVTACPSPRFREPVQGGGQASQGPIACYRLSLGVRNSGVIRQPEFAPFHQERPDRFPEGSAPASDCLFF